MNPFRLVSLLEILETQAGPFWRLSSLLGQAIIRLESEMPSPKTIGDMLHSIQIEIEALGLRIAMAQMARVKETVFDGSMTRDNLRTGLLELHTRISDELDDRHFLSLPPQGVPLYSPTEPLFGSDVEEAFPSAAFDVSEAGKCLALGRWTAGVMHLMRALEPALVSLQAAVAVTVPKEQWNQVLDQIETAIRGVTKRTHSTEMEQWFSEAATHFRMIKNSWRNYAMHGHVTYDEERAMDIYRSVRAFMRFLSEKLKEPAA